MTHDAKRSLGERGEQIAVQHLEANGYTIIERNWHCPFGELDIIAKQADVLVFVEVRSRKMESPYESLDEALASVIGRKRDRLIRAAHAYVEAHEIFEQEWRLDVIAVGFTYGGRFFVEQVEDALGW